MSYIDPGTRTVMNLISAGMEVPSALSTYEMGARNALAAQVIQQVAQPAPVQPQPAPVQSAQQPTYQNLAQPNPTYTPPVQVSPIPAPVMQQPTGLVDGLQLTPVEAAQPDIKAELAAMLTEYLAPVKSMLAGSEEARKLQSEQQAIQQRKEAARQTLMNVDLGDPHAVDAFLSGLVAHSQAPAQTPVEVPTQSTSTIAPKTDPVSVSAQTIEATTPGFKQVMNSKEFAAYARQPDPFGLATVNDRFIEALAMNTEQGQLAAKRIVEAFVMSQRAAPPGQLPPVQYSGQPTGNITPQLTAAPQTVTAQMNALIKDLGRIPTTDFGAYMQRIKQLNAQRTAAGEF